MYLTLFFSSSINWYGLTQYTNQFHVFDSRRQKWLAFPNMTIPRSFFSCAVIEHPQRGIEIVAAGALNADTNMTEIFNFQDGSWREGPPLPRPYCAQVAVPYKDSFLLVSGVRSDKKVMTSTIFKYNIVDDAWELMKERVPMPREAQVAMMVAEELVPCPGHAHQFQ